MFVQGLETTNYSSCLRVGFDPANVSNFGKPTINFHKPYPLCVILPCLGYLMLFWNRSNYATKEFFSGVTSSTYFFLHILPEVRLPKWGESSNPITLILILSTPHCPNGTWFHSQQKPMVSFRGV